MLVLKIYFSGADTTLGIVTVNMGPIGSGHGRLGEPGITLHPRMAQGRRDHLSISKNIKTMSNNYRTFIDLFYDIFDTFPKCFNYRMNMIVKLASYNFRKF